MPISARFPAALLLAACTLPMSAHAAGDYDNCAGFIDSIPAYINTQGTWCLRKDLATSITSGHAITIKANNVTLDCNGFKIGGLSAGAGTQADGIGVRDQVNITIRHCNIRGFLHGVAISGLVSSGHIIEDNRVERSRQEGIAVVGEKSIIRRNLVRDTGGSTFTPSYARGITANGSNDVLDNTIVGVAPLGDATGDGLAFGIYSEDNLSGSISGNRIRGLAPAGAAGGYGFYGLRSERVSLVGNEVVGSAGAHRGLRCFNNRGRAKDNVVSGFPEAITNCGDDGNIVVP